MNVASLIVPSFFIKMCFNSVVKKSAMFLLRRLLQVFDAYNKINCTKNDKNKIARRGFTSAFIPFLQGLMNKDNICA